MTKSLRSKLASLLGVTLLASSLALAAFPGTAAADNVSASATGLKDLSLLGGQLLQTPACTATGTPAGVSYPQASGDSNCGVTPVPTAPLLDLGALGRDVLVDTNGHSAACAGLVADGGSLEIGDDFGCTAVGGTGRGLEVVQTSVPPLPPLSLVGLDAAYAACAASATGSVTTSAVVRGLTVLGTNLGNILDAAPNTSLLGGVVELNKQVVTPGRITVTALILNVPGVLRVAIGEATCAVDAVNNDSTSAAFDTAGDVVDPSGKTVQNGTRNALRVTFTPGGDRNDATGVIRLGPGVAIDTSRGPVNGNFQADSLPAGCDAIQNAVAPLDPRIVCDLGDLVGGTPVVRTIPVTLAETVPAGGFFEATAQLFASTTNPVAQIATGPGPLNGPNANGGRGPVFGLGALPTNVPADRVGLVQVAPEVQQNIFQVQDGTTLTIPDLDDDLDLPETVPGKLYLDLPDFVESVTFSGTVDCDIVDENPVPATEVIPSAYPFLADAGSTRWDCGQIPQGAAANRTLELDVAAGTPKNAAGAVGRAVVLRRTNPVTFSPPAVQENSFYSNLLIQVTNSVVVTPDPVPNVTVTVAPASRPAPGGDFTYTVTVANPTATGASITGLSQKIRNNNGAFGAASALTGDADCKVGTALPAGSSCTFDFVDALTGVTGDSETHQVNATLTGGFTDATPGEATARLGDARTLTVVKTVADDDLVAPGGDFTYTVKVTNPNSVPVTIATLKDTVGTAAPVTLTGDSDCKVGTVLAAGASCEFSFTLPFTGTAGATQSDVVTVTVTDPDGATITGTSNGVTVKIVSPTGLTLDLTADPTSLPEPGGKVTFTLKATNSLAPATDGSNDLKITALKVQYNPTVDASTMDNSTCKTGTVLKPGESTTCTFTDEVSGNAGDVITYTALGTATDPSNDVYTDDDPATVTLTDVKPEITVTETVTPASKATPGGEFTWVVTIQNTSKASSDPVTITSLRNELLADPRIDDAKVCGELIGVTLDAPTATKEGEKATCTFTTKVEGPDGKVATDTAVAVAEDDEGNSTSDLGTAAVSLTAGGTTTTVAVAGRTALPKTGASTRTTAAAAMLFAGLGLVLTGGGMQQPTLATAGQRRRRR